MENNSPEFNEPKLAMTNDTVSSAKVKADWRKRMSRRRYQRPRPRIEFSNWYIFLREDFQQPDGTVTRKKMRACLGPVDSMNYTQAVRAAEQYTRRINSISYRPRSGMTFREFSEKWTETCLKAPAYKPSSIPAIRSGMHKHLVPAFGDLELSDIGAEHVDRFTSSSDSIAGKTVRNLLFIMKSVLRKAVAWGYLPDDTDWFRGVDLPTAERGKGRVFSAEQVQAIIRNADEPYRTFYWVIAETAFRAGEACGLRWSDIDLVNASIRLTDSVWRGKRMGSTKTRDTRPTPISRALAAALADLQRSAQMSGTPCEHKVSENSALGIRNPDSVSASESGLIFHSKNETPWYPDLVVKRKLHPLLDRLGIARAGLHAFRHALGTEWLRSGVDVKTVQAQLGHASASTTLDFYAHGISDDRRRAVEQWSSVIGPRKNPDQSG